MASTQYRVWFGFTLNGTKHRRGTHVVLDSADPKTQALIDAGKIRVEIGDLGDLAVTTEDIADLAVTEGKLAANAVTTAKIKDGTIVDADVAAAAAIDPSKIAQNRVTFSNEDKVVAATTRHLSQIGTLNAARTVTLPAANAVAAGTEIIVSDDSGTVTSTNTITIARAGSDTINGATSEVIKTAYGWRRLVSDGTSKWSFDGGLLRAGRNLADVGAAATALGNIGGYPGRVFTSGLYYKGDITGNVSTATTSVNYLSLQPFTTSQNITIDRIALEVTNGLASSYIRLGIYSNIVGGYGPDARLLDTGQIDASTNAVKEATVSVALTPGTYWLGYVAQGSAIDVRTAGALGVWLALANTVAANPSALTIANVSGALPATGVGYSVSQATVSKANILVRVA